jgi:1,4-alpha-glucan branching enzyme
LSDFDLHLFNEGTHTRIYDKLGAHPGVVAGAPEADAVTVIGDFNGWDPNATPLRPRANSGIWEGNVAGVGPAAPTSTASVRMVDASSSKRLTRTHLRPSSARGQHPSSGT